MSDRDSSSSSGGSSDSGSNSSSSSDEGSSKTKKFAYSSGNCKRLSRWLITGLKEQEIKKARKAFQPKFKVKEDLLCNPILDDAFYLRLKTARRSAPSKSNIDAKAKKYPKPLLFLNGRTRHRKKYKSDVKAIQTAVKLWASLFKEVLFTRRHNILSQIYPGFLNLLDDPKNLKGGGQLFGPQFLDKLVSQAKVQSTLGDIKTPGSVPPPTGRQHNNPPKEPVNFRRPSEGHKGYDHLSLAFSSCFGGRIGRFIEGWCAITSDPWILESVAGGVRLEFLSSPTQLTAPRNAVRGPDQEALCNEEVQGLLEKGEIRETDS
ncbi:hypothetical protein OUZ56_021883 [Daphnia magna]|uniref:Uncharacterized protein n=1 Tax=Daphnia magna TaxID=35525 RepID=A0ABR0AUQ9_9CRUS|nr:hypothetical protein OUZ56_021883 [Daphnia magna]